MLPPTMATLSLAVCRACGVGCAGSGVPWHLHAMIEIHARKTGTMSNWTAQTGSYSLRSYALIQLLMFHCKHLLAAPLEFIAGAPLWHCPSCRMPKKSLL